MRFVEFCNKTVTRLLSRDCSAPVKRLQHSCQEIAAVLSRDYTPVSAPVIRLQHSCKQNARILKFLSSMHLIHITLLPVHSNKKVSHSLKNARILKFLSSMHFIHITLLPVHSNEKVSHSLKNGRRE